MRIERLAFALFLLLALPAGTGLAASKGISWETDYAEARRKSVIEGKPLMIFFFRPGCQSCAQVENTLADQEVIGNARRFICLRINVREEGTVPALFAVRQVPTFKFLTVELDDESTRENIILHNHNLASVEGPQEPDAFVATQQRVVFQIWDNSVTEMAGEAMKARDLMRVVSCLEGRFFRRSEEYLTAEQRQEMVEGYRNALRAALNDARSRRDKKDEAKILVRLLRSGQEAGIAESDIARYRQQLKELLYRQATTAMRSKNVPETIDGLSQLLIMRELIGLSPPEAQQLESQLHQLDQSGMTLLAQAQQLMQKQKNRAADAAATAWRVKRAFPPLPAADRAEELLNTWREDPEVGPTVTAFIRESEAELLFAVGRQYEAARELFLAARTFQRVQDEYEGTNIAAQARAALSRITTRSGQALEEEGRRKAQEMMERHRFLGLTGHLREERELLREVLILFPGQAVAEEARRRLADLERVLGQ